MLDDGTVLKLHFPEWCTALTKGYLLSVESPERDCVPVDIVKHGTSLCMTPTGPDGWLERRRVACPPALLVTGIDPDLPDVGF